jgi:hypothetical protein
MEYIKKLIQSFFPNSDNTSITLILLIIGLFIWLFKEMKSQLDESRSKKIERVDMTLLSLGQLLDAINDEQNNREKIQKQFHACLPYIDHRTYSRISKELRKESIELKEINELICNHIGKLKLKYNYINQHSSDSLIEQIELILLPVKNIFIPLIGTFGVFSAIAIFSMLYVLTNGDPFLTVVKFFSLILIMFIILIQIDLTTLKRININLRNISAFLVFLILPIFCIFITNIWMVLIVIVGYVIGFRYLLKLKRH